MIKHILFVDDEPNVLAGLRRMLHPMRRDWQMEFVDSSEAALSALATHPFDAIVSDIHMPGMDGVALLDEVKRRYPAAGRIVLSGHGEMRAIIESVGVAHQYLAKPCDPETLRSTIDRICTVQSLLADRRLQALIAQMDALPSLPSLYVEVVQELSTPEGSLAKVGAIIGKDLGMTAKILQIVNSAFFGLRRHISSPAEAATLLGLNVLRPLILTTKVFYELEVAGGCLDFEALLNHSVAMGTFARRIAEMEDADPVTRDHALLAGMLHDLGKLVLAARLPAEYRDVQAIRVEQGLSECTAERSLVGCTHMEVGAYLAGLWGLPGAIVEALAFHHTPSHASGAQFTPLTAVHIAEALSGDGYAPADGSDGPALRIDVEYLERLGISARLPHWIAEDARRQQAQQASS